MLRPLQSRNNEAIVEYNCKRTARKGHEYERGLCLTGNFLVVLVIADEVRSDDEESGDLRGDQSLHGRILSGLHLTAFGHDAEPTCRIANTSISVDLNLSEIIRIYLALVLRV